MSNLSQAALRGDTEAMFRLSAAFAFGFDGMPMDADDALYWLKKAAKAGHTVAAEVLKDIGRTRETSNEVGECEGDEKIKRVQLWKDGPYWADRNIGAENPWDSGYYFWWGDTIGYKGGIFKWVTSDGSNSNFSFEFSNAPTHGKSTLELGNKGWITENGVLAPEHDAAQKHWGGNWRMPTAEELVSLWKNCAWTWSKMNGVKGYVVRGIGNYAAQSIFLPCAGYGHGTSLVNAGSRGYYWSSVSYSDCRINAWYLYFYSNYLSTTTNYRYDGLSVRPLQGFTK
jgi:hypothetical protein